MLINKYPLCLIQLKKYVMVWGLDLHTMKYLFFYIIKRLPNNKRLALEDLDCIYKQKQGNNIMETLVDLIKFLVYNCQNDTVSEQLINFYQQGRLEYYLDNIDNYVCNIYSK